jgi:hypothetical protein
MNVEKEPSICPLMQEKGVSTPDLASAANATLKTKAGSFESRAPIKPSFIFFSLAIPEGVGVDRVGLLLK